MSGLRGLSAGEARLRRHLRSQVQLAERANKKPSPLFVAALERRRLEAIILDCCHLVKVADLDSRDARVADIIEFLNRDLKARLQMADVRHRHSAIALKDLQVCGVAAMKGEQHQLSR